MSSNYCYAASIFVKFSEVIVQYFIYKIGCLTFNHFAFITFLQTFLYTQAEPI